METHIRKIKELAKQKENENWELRDFLQNSKVDPAELSELVRSLFMEISAEIDCTQCANCCNEAIVEMYEDDIRKLAKCVGISTDEFIETYLDKSPHSERYVVNRKPCPFLNGRLCSHYEHRPVGCRKYPYLEDEDIMFNLLHMIGNTFLCPIVYHVCERLKAEVWGDDDSGD